MRKFFHLVVAMVLLGVVFGLPTRPIEAASLLDITIEQPCTLAIHFNVAAADPAGTYLIEVWDNGWLIGSVSVAVNGAGTYTGRVLVQNPWPRPDGLGIYLYFPNGADASNIDPYFPNGLDAACGAGPDMVPMTPDAVVGMVKSDTALYFAPRADAMVKGLTLSAGKTVWVLGMDASRQYYQIVLAGKYLWVPAAALGPNYDEVWAGTPLPTTVVQ